jgi:hypothetical protein
VREGDSPLRALLDGGGRGNQAGGGDESEDDGGIHAECEKCGCEFERMQDGNMSVNKSY